MEGGFFVVFEYMDGTLADSYFYWTYENAREHFDLFRGDDSGLYRKIELKFAETDEVLHELAFC